ncbi:MAG: arginine--tRNA ligase [Sphaerobacteraceae bacterium]|nr:MAG: arginine--tRNA ligase [Sphaerobacteraceae bacterium]
MLQREQERAAGRINDVLEGLGFGRREFTMRPIPFAGTWGTSSSICYQLANEQISESGDPELEGLSKKQAKKKMKELVGPRAQSIAEQIAERLASDDDFASAEASNGYINIEFDTQRFANRVVGTIGDQASEYGRGEKKADKVMVEYSQPNTHKAFHIGHLRNATLGNTLCRIMDLAGYEVQKANYIGDIGMHVIKCLWCYERFHQGEEPELSARGRWLGDIYTESDQRVNFRQDVLTLLNELANNDPAFVAMVDRMVKELYQVHDVGEDVAYLLGQIANKREIKDESFYDQGTIPKFWPIVGKQLHVNLEMSRGERERHDDIEDEIPQPSQYEEWIERWDLLGSRMDWWPHVNAWREEIKAEFQRWERKDPDFVSLWETTKQWSMVDFHRIYDEIDVTFDTWFYESEVEEPGREIVKDLMEREIAEISEGLPVVKIDEKLGLEKETYRTMPVLRSDGTTLYSTKDLALTKHKFEEYGVDRSIWVVDVRQGLYFQQIFKIMELMGFEQAEKCFHLGYEMVTLPSGAMSSRSGNVILYDDIAREVLERAREIIDEKNPELPDAQKDDIAHDVGIGSLKYSMLSRDNNRVIVFDVEESLSFDGHAAPYIQYAHARACRILEKVDVMPSGELTFADLTAEEIDLIQQIAIFPTEIQRAAEEYKPLYIATYVFELAKKFNDFYRACPVLQAEEPTRAARVALVNATRQVLANGLAAIGIEAPEVM